MTLDPNLVLLAIAIFNAFTAAVGWLTLRTAKATQKEVVTVRDEVVTVKKEMNGMKDAVVDATGKAERAAGRDEERVLGEAKAAALAQGNLEGKKTGE